MVKIFNYEINLDATVGQAKGVQSASVLPDSIIEPLLATDSGTVVNDTTSIVFNGLLLTYSSKDNRLLYKIKAGDNLTRISNKLGISQTDLMKMNDIKDADKIDINDALTCGYVYTVNNKDKNLTAIAKKLGIFLNDLTEMNKKINKDFDPNKIRIGDPIFVLQECQKAEVANKTEVGASEKAKPAETKTDTAETKKVVSETKPTPAKAETIPKTHKVASGESLSVIAQKYGIPVKKLAAWNKISNMNSLRIDQVLKLEKPNSIEEVDKIVKNFTGGKIPIDNVHDIKTVAQYTGLSEDYISDILVGIEGRNNWPLCVAEYDGVKDTKKTKHTKGYLTIGFGHTSLSGEPEVYEEMEITKKQAYQILANDIAAAQKYVKNKLKNNGINQDNVPKSIQNAMIDAYFNKGPDGITKKFINKLKKGDYMSAACETWYNTATPGLYKRNIYRFIEAIKDIPRGKNKKNGIIIFKNEHEKEMLIAFSKDNDAKVAWNEMCDLNKYPEAKF